jgi:hypothetical protein
MLMCAESILDSLLTSDGCRRQTLNMPIARKAGEHHAKYVGLCAVDGCRESSDAGRQIWNRTVVFGSVIHLWQRVNRGEDLRCIEENVGKSANVVAARIEQNRPNKSHHVRRTIFHEHAVNIDWCEL